MRALLRPFPYLPDVVSLLVFLLAVTVIYLCSLPETFHSFAHRKEQAAGRLELAHNLVLKESDLFRLLIEAKQQERIDALRQEVARNGQEFHALAVRFGRELPEEGIDIGAMVELFDHMDNVGWQSEAAARRGDMDVARITYDWRFSHAEEEAQTSVKRIAVNLHLVERNN